jgi:hypothetical protein
VIVPYGESPPLKDSIMNNTPFLEDDEDDDYEEYDEELARDQILERQELEDFEGFDPFESDLGNEW